MYKNLLLIVISFFVLTASFPKAAAASGGSDFGSCLNPQGEKIVSYESGEHGIVGEGEATGSDAVYKSSNNGVTQCMCPDTGNGIQTNWMRATDLSKAEIDIKKKEGWIYVATGSNWGLNDEPYLAKNIKYACRKNAKVNKNEKILGLASTGDSITIYAFLLSGAAFLISGLVLRKFSR